MTIIHQASPIQRVYLSSVARNLSTNRKAGRLLISYKQDKEGKVLTGYKV
jgi:hypothetical protein